MGVPFEARATATGDGDGFELVLYVPLADLERDTDAVGRLGELCRSVVEVGAGQELLVTSGAYAQLAHAGKVPELLSATGTLSAIEPPGLAPVADAWEPIGLGAIQDLVQSQLGPVDLDRSPVSFEARPEPMAGCPACAGRRLGFPAELSDERGAMCAAHAARADQLVTERLSRAQASNPEGWKAITDASTALGAPTYGLPLDLLDRLDEAVERAFGEDTTQEDLRRSAAAALELADRLSDRPDEFEAWVDAFMAHDWMCELPWDLARRDLLDEAVQVADAFAELGGDHRSLYANDAAVLLAEAGRADEARARIEDNLLAFPGDVWTRVHAGDVHQALGNLARAEQEFRRAAILADAGGSSHDAAAVAQRIADVLTGQPGREHEAAQAAQHALARERGQRVVRKVGRNQPCPCGSGRKYKRCCAA